MVSKLLDLKWGLVAVQWAAAGFDRSWGCLMGWWKYVVSLDSKTIAQCLWADSKLSTENVSVLAEWNRHFLFLILFQVRQLSFSDWFENLAVPELKNSHLFNSHSLEICVYDNRVNLLVLYNDIHFFFGMGAEPLCMKIMHTA